VEHVEEGGSAGAWSAGSSAGPFGAGPVRDPSSPRVSCRFLLRPAADGALDPVSDLDPANRCVALVDQVPQSIRQQDLVCLASAHVNCPRYLRGLLLAGAPAPRPVREPLSPAIVAAAVVLAASLAASFGFLVVRGGFDLPLLTPRPTTIALASVPVVPLPSPFVVSPPPSAVVSAAPVAPSVAPIPSALPSPTPSPQPTPSPAPTPAPTPRTTPKPAPTSDRFAFLTRCPSTPDCWIYVVRSGDNLRSIANYFGVSYERVLRMNPTIGDPSTIRRGDRIRIPTPTR
jgi:hypothetical protein